MEPNYLFSDPTNFEIEGNGSDRASANQCVLQYRYSRYLYLCHCHSPAMIPDLGPAWTGEWGQRPEIPQDGHFGMDMVLKQAGSLCPTRRLLPQSVLVADRRRTLNWA